MGPTMPPWRVALLDDGDEAYVAFDADAALVYCTDAAAQLLGYTVEQMLGARVLDLVHPDDLHRAGVNIKGVTSGARPRPGMLRIRHRRDGWIPLELSPWSLDLPEAVGGPGPVTVVTMRDTSQNDTHWAFLAALAAGERFADCVELFADGLSSRVDGPMGISYEGQEVRRSVGPVPASLTGVGDDGLIDTAPGTPWAKAAAEGAPCWMPVDDLPEPHRTAAAGLGAAIVVAMAVPDPASAQPALMVQYPSDPVMGDILCEALRRRPREALAVALDRRAVMRRLERLAMHDPLTEVANRARFFDVLASFVDDQVGYGICYVDLDRFKAINDTHGHRIGDQVIVACAQRLVRAARDSGVVARLGGDEFAIACRNVAEPDLAAIAQRLVATLGEPVVVGGLTLEVGASVGFAVGAPAADPDAVLGAADAALYQAKSDGRGQWRQGATVA